MAAARAIAARAVGRAARWSRCRSSTARARASSRVTARRSGRRLVDVTGRRALGSYFVLSCVDDEGPAPRAGPVLHARRGGALGRGRGRAAVPAAGVLGRAGAPRRRRSTSCSRTSAPARAGWPSCGPATGCGCWARSGNRFAARREAPPAPGRRRRRDRAAGDPVRRARRPGARAARLPRRRARRGRGADRAARGWRPTTARVGHHGLVTELLRGGARRDARRGLRLRAAADARGGAGAVRGAWTCRRSWRMESGMACGFGACFGCVVATKTGYVRLCVDGPVRGGRRRTDALWHPTDAPDHQRVGHVRRDRRPPRVRRRAARALPVQRLRDEDRHARAAPGQPAAAAVGARRRDDQLDRASQQGARDVPGRGPAEDRRAAGARRRQRHGLDAGRVRPPRRGDGRPRRGRGAGAQRVLSRT